MRYFCKDSGICFGSVSKQKKKLTEAEADELKNSGSVPSDVKNGTYNATNDKYQSQMMTALKIKSVAVQTAESIKSVANVKDWATVRGHIAKYCKDNGVSGYVGSALYYEDLGILICTCLGYSPIFGSAYLASAIMNMKPTSISVVVGSMFDYFNGVSQIMTSKLKAEKNRLYWAENISYLFSFVFARLYSDRVVENVFLKSTQQNIANEMEQQVKGLITKYYGSCPLLVQTSAYNSDGIAKFWADKIDLRLLGDKVNALGASPSPVVASAPVDSDDYNRKKWDEENPKCEK